MTAETGHNSGDARLRSLVEIRLRAHICDMPRVIIRRSGRDPIKRFMDKAEVSPGGCVEWKGSKTPDGYGHFSWCSRPVYAHRFAYEAANGSIPPGLVIDHLCRNPSCVNPSHLECVPMAENTRRGIHKEVIRAKAKQKTLCKRGHPLFGANVRINAEGHRGCITCQRLMADIWKDQNRDRVNEMQRIRRAGGGS